MIKPYLFISLLLISMQSLAYEPRDLLQKKADVQQVKKSLQPKSKWIKYPAYTNRTEWDAFTGKFKEELIKKGEQYLPYEWKVVPATSYLEYERTGNRVIMEQPLNSNMNALSRLLLAELAEGKGRFMDQIINGVWQASEMTSWALSAHLTVQKSKRSLPDFDEQIIDLVSGDIGSLLSWAWHFLHEEWDKVNPAISHRLQHEIQKRILEPYMARNDFWWQALNYKPGMLVNNWNVWCNFNVLTCFLIMEENPDQLAAAVHKSMRSVDQFINYNNEDGACEEGPSYWGHAAGKLYDYLQLLSNATHGEISLFQEPIIKNLGEYIANSYVGNGWVVNFADASAKGGGSPGLIYRYGKAVNSETMQHFAAYLAKKQNNYNIHEGRDFFRTIENLRSFDNIQSTQPALPTFTAVWYPQTQFCYIKQNGFFFAAKGGYNSESHNHNDIGTFSLYADEVPMFIDAGVGTYTRQTFSKERYTIWTMQSNYHNIPAINGMQQEFGAKYRAKNAEYDAGKTSFSLDISGAYPGKAAVKKWIRSYKLSETELQIDDTFELAETIAPNVIHFLTWGKPILSQPGEILIQKGNKGVVLHYDAAAFEAETEAIPQTDKRLSNVWGSEIYRISLTAKKKELSGRYHFVVKKEQL